LSLFNRNTKKLERVSISQTATAQKALLSSPIPFEKIAFSIQDVENLSIMALRNRKAYITNDLSDMLYPAVKREIVKTVQKKLGILSSIVFPIYSRDLPLGTIIFSLSKLESEILKFEKQILLGFVNAVGIAIDHAFLFKKLRNANLKLKLLDKQKDEFLNMAAHELRAPMTAIKGYISMIIQGDAGEIPEKARRYLVDASAVTDRLVRLVNNMLNVSRIEEGRLIYQIEKENLSVPVQSVFNQFRPEAERKGLDYVLDIPRDIKDKVEVDPDRIQEVIGNLVSNAIKYTEKGFVKLSLSQSEPARIRFEVSDSGPGISEEELKKLFGKFYRAESSIGKTTGTGLGLYISKLLVEKFGGKIGVNSKLGEGSVFWFELPVVN
ncbi:MAG: GAF domain-containing sensor histidine kinase, partial [Patescibacteria group bacterium]|nr:GAF domain-containing sensor histidine kinase [Patescibacteria group bacterium]